MVIAEKQRISLTSICLAFMLGFQFGCTAVPIGQTTQKFKTEVNVKSYSTYLIYLPSNYYRENNKNWPLIVFLHGYGPAGTDIEALRQYALPKEVEKNHQFQFVVVSPQWGKQQSWEPQMVKAFIERIRKTIRIDVNRICLTGISLGGVGTWNTAIEYPELFTAIVPIAGYCDESKACRLRAVPVWAFHGAKDMDVSPLFSSNMVKAINVCGGKAKLTLYPDLAHDCWTVTYANMELYAWLLEQTVK